MGGLKGANFMALREMLKLRDIDSIRMPGFLLTNKLFLYTLSMKLIVGISISHVKVFYCFEFNCFNDRSKHFVQIMVCLF